MSLMSLQPMDTIGLYWTQQQQKEGACDEGTLSYVNVLRAKTIANVLGYICPIVALVRAIFTAYLYTQNQITFEFAISQTARAFVELCGGGLVVLLADLAKTAWEHQAEMKAYIDQFKAYMDRPNKFHAA
jgi:hypothetical protein